MNSQIVPEGIAAKCGKLRMGDRILKVNGSDVTGATHQEAVMELLRPCDSIVLTIQHDPLPAGFQVRVAIFPLFSFARFAFIINHLSLEAFERSKFKLKF